MIANSEIVLCPWCGNESTLEDWDKQTYSQCKNRDMRRSYIHLENEKVWMKDSTNFYMCPDCGNWVRGNKLKLRNENLSHLGGQPIIEIVDNV